MSENELHQKVSYVLYICLASMFNLSERKTEMIWALVEPPEA